MNIIPHHVYLIFCISVTQVQQFTLFVIVGAEKSILDFKCYYLLSV